jgi:hypothetical protein
MGENYYQLSRGKASATPRSRFFRKLSADCVELQNWQVNACDGIELP